MCYVVSSLVWENSLRDLFIFQGKLDSVTFHFIFYTLIPNDYIFEYFSDINRPGLMAGGIADYNQIFMNKYTLCQIFLGLGFL